MKRILAAVLTAMILVSTAWAGPDPDETRTIGRFGHVGLWNTLSAQPLGYGRLSLNVYANHSLDKDYIKNVYRWFGSGDTPGERAPVSRLEFDPRWDYVDARPTITTFNFSIAYGLTRFLDMAVMLPLYIDNIGDGFVFPDRDFVWPLRDGPSAWIGNGIWTQTGVGDLEVSLKFRYPPVQHNTFFQMAYYGALSIPTGVENHGWFPRGTQFLDQRMGAAYMFNGLGSPGDDHVLRSNVGAYNNYTTAAPEVDMKMLWTWDFRELADNFPVLFHVNYGVRWITQHRNDHLFYLNSALEVRPAHWLSIFADFSASPRFSSIAQESSFAAWRDLELESRHPDSTYRFTPTAAGGNSIARGLRDDPLRISPGAYFMTPIGITVSAGVDISLANDYGVFIGDRQTSQSGTMDVNVNPAPIFSDILMEVGVEPKVRFVASLGWNGLTVPSLPIAAPIVAPRQVDTIRVIDTVFLERLIIDTLRLEVEVPATPTPTFNITASIAAGQGTITPLGINTVMQGRLVVYNITPAQGYSVGQVIVDGVNVGAVMQHTFPSVSQNHTISVVFNQNPVEIIEIPAPIAFEIPREGLVLRGVNFRIGSAELLPESYSALDQVVRSLRDWPEVRLEVQGHTSAEGRFSAGRVANNLRLSRERANSVMQYFIQQGIPASQLRAVGMGEEFPIASNETESGRIMNRRVTLVRID